MIAACIALALWACIDLMIGLAAIRRERQERRAAEAFDRAARRAS